MGVVTEKKADPWIDKAVEVAKAAGLLFQELGSGVWNNTIHWPFCCSLAALAGLSIVTHVDFLLWKRLAIAKHYPIHSTSYWIYCAILMSFGFLLWAFYRAVVRFRLTNRLKETFTNAGLKTRMNKYPSFISDFPLDRMTRKLRLHAAGLPQGEFEKAKEALQMNLHVFIDQIKTNVKKGTVDIIYSHYSLETDVPLPDIASITNYGFMVGETRAGPMIVSLRDVPHLLIAGFTQAGKSSFLRQFITTLFLNNPRIRFTLIDLKRGLEFQLFESLKGIKVVSDAREALAALKRIEEEMGKRLDLFRLNRCTDFSAFMEILEEKRVYPPDWSQAKSLGRSIIVIDEAAELFLVNSLLSSKEVQAARRLASKIAAQGRAAGVHLVVATQRPDRNAVDPLTKTNLQGRLCYQMADNASSMTILDSVRAADLPGIKGRAIWRNGLDLLEVQTPWLSPDQADTLLKESRTQKKDGKPSSQDSDSKQLVLSSDSVEKPEDLLDGNPNEKGAA